MEDIYFLQTLLLIILGIYPEVRLLDHVVVLFSFLKGKDCVWVDFLFLSMFLSLCGTVHG